MGVPYGVNTGGHHARAPLGPIGGPFRDAYFGVPIWMVPFRDPFSGLRLECTFGGAHFWGPYFVGTLREGTVGGKVGRPFVWRLW
jgi:hypothetical protein